MFENITPPSIIFRASLRFLVQANELFSCFNPWIITPPVYHGEHRALLYIEPFITTVTYAILEPLASRELLRSGFDWPPWTYLWRLSPLHLIFSLYSVLVYTALRSKVKSSKDASLEPSGYVMPTRREILVQVWVTLTLVFLVISSVVINATLLSFSQNIYKITSIEELKIPLLAPATILIFLVCRYGDYEICRQTCRGRSWYQAIFYQTMLIAVRAFVRNLVGLSPILAFQTLGVGEEGQDLGSQRHGVMEDSRKVFLLKVTLGLGLASVPFMMAGYHLMRPASRMEEAEGEESSDSPK